MASGDEEQVCMLISFIIPVYNRASLLKECLSSILSSSWRDFEIILVDNASTDESPRVCDQYSAQYSFIHTVHLVTNRGPGPARKYGAELATGKWLFFLDSDDLICTENIESIVAKLSTLPDEVDLVVIDMVDEFGGVQWDYLYFSKYEILTYQNFLEKYPTFVHVPLWNYLFKKESIRKKGLELPEISHSEDVYFVHQIFHTNGYIACIPIRFYCYRYNVSNNSVVKYSQYDEIRMVENQLMRQLCDYIKEYRISGDYIREKAYTQALISVAFYLMYLRYGHVTPHIKHVQYIELDSSCLEEIGIDKFIENVFHNVLQKAKKCTCFLPRAGKASCFFADYLFLYGHHVLGMFDNYSTERFVITLQGHKIPVFLKSSAKDVCNSCPILFLDNSNVMAKMEKYFCEMGIKTIHWGL